MANSRDPRKPTPFHRGAKRYGNVGGHSPPDDTLENTRDHERIWFELKRSRSCCDCEDPGFKYCFETFDYPGYICDGQFAGGDTLEWYGPGYGGRLGSGEWYVAGGCFFGDKNSETFTHDPTFKRNGSWRDGQMFRKSGFGNGLVIQHNANSLFPNIDWTFEFWIRPSQADIDAAASLSSAGPGGGTGSGMFFSSLTAGGGIAMRHGQVAGGVLQASGDGWIEAEQWHHIAYVRNTVTRTLAFFVNGRLAISRVIPTTGWTATSDDVFSVSMTQGSWWADLAKYSSALPPAIIRRHYQAIYGVEGAANPFASVEGDPLGGDGGGTVEDPGDLILDPIAPDIIDGGGDGLVGYFLESQGDYSKWTSPEDTPFELEERKSQADGYASLDSSALVPTAELATGTADRHSFLRGDRIWQPGNLPPEPTQMGDILIASPPEVDEWWAAFQALWSAGTSYNLEFESAPAGWTAIGAPTYLTADPAFTGSPYVSFAPGDGYSKGSALSTLKLVFGAWIRLNALPGSTVNLARHGSATGNGFRLRSDGLIEVFATTDVHLTSVTPLPVDEWVHVICAIDNDGASTGSKIWINGAVDATGPGDTDAAAATYQVAGDGFDGAMSYAFFNSFGVGGGSPLDADVAFVHDIRYPIWYPGSPADLGITGGIDASEDDTPITAAPRPRINFKAGTNVAVTVTDDAGDDEVEVEITATSPAGAGIEVSEEGVDISASPRGRLDFVSGAALDVTDDAGNDKVIVTIPTGGGGGNTADENQTAHGFSVGEVIRRDSGGTYELAQADTLENAAAIGIVTAVADVDNFTFAFIGPVTGLSGLTDGTVYYLDPATPGALTATEPTTTGEISKALLIATSTTTGLFLNWRGAVVQ